MTVLNPTSSFIDAQRYGAVLVDARMTIYVNGAPNGVVTYQAVSTGSLTVDRNSNQRMSGQLTIEAVPTIPPPAILPINPKSLLAPFGNEIFLETGIAGTQTVAKNSDGSINLASLDWIPSGLYAIATTTVDDTSTDLTCTLDLYDRSWTIAQRALKNPYNLPATGSTNLVAEIQMLLNQVWAQDPNMAPLQYNLMPTTATVPVASYDQGSDPWQIALDLAAAAGYELFFNRNGVVTGYPVPNPYLTPVSWNFTDQETDIAGLSGTGSTALLGGPYSTPPEVSVVMTRDGIYNDEIVQGTGDANMATYSGTGLETSGPPILAERFDNNPQSPTYVGGGMGDVPNFISSSLVTPAGAGNYAQNQLNVALSSSWTVTITIAPTPGLDVDMVATITRPRVGLYRTKVVIDTVTQSIRYADTDLVTGRVLAQPFNIGE